MIINSVKLENYRNIKEARIEFSEGVNVIEGMNAQGKTNLLESVYFMSLGRSFRHSPDSELIMMGEKRCFAELCFTDSVRREMLDLELTHDRSLNTQKKIRRVMRLNRVPLSKMSEIVGVFRSVLFCPDHLSIVKEGPSVRRAWIDVAISQLDPRYMAELKRYSKILAERNSLIKNYWQPGGAEVYNDTIETWSLQLAESGARLTVMRCDYLQKISRHVDRFFEEMTGVGSAKEKIDLSYLSSARGYSSQKDADSDGFEEIEEKAKNLDCSEEKRIKDRLFELFMTRKDREIATGSTLFGIHKDDIGIKINGVPARNFASQGQGRSISLAMKLAEGEVSCEMSGESPVYLLDDMLSELDARRREYILSELRERQVIVTTCEDLSSIIKRGGGAKIIHAEGGRFS